MNCREAQRFVQVFVDGELDPHQVLEIESHLETCPTCRNVAEFETWFKGEVRACVSSVATPSELNARVRSALGRAERQDRVRAVAATGAVFAGLAACIVAAVLLPDWLVRRANVDEAPLATPFIDDVARGHSRNYPAEVSGPDAVSVGRWFENKVDFAVTPPSFPENRVELVGGRLSHVGNRQAAQILYERDGRRISVIVFETHGIEPSDARRLRAGPRTVYVGGSRGYNVAMWQQGDIAYAVSSDLEEPEMVRLVSSVR